MKTFNTLCALIASSVALCAQSEVASTSPVLGLPRLKNSAEVSEIPVIASSTFTTDVLPVPLRLGRNASLRNAC